MKAVIICTLLFVVLAAATAPVSEETRFLFTQWAKQHGKTYSTISELNTRLQAFQDNLNFIQQHNAEAAEGKWTFTVGLTKFADLTNQEYRSLYLGYRPSNATRSAANLYIPRPVSALPSSVDWRQKNVVTPVKDQGQCGSCWSFSSTGSMEGAHALATGNLISLSEQNLIDCVENGSFTCDMGGEMQAAFEYVIQQSHGIETEANYPYCTCSGHRCQFSSSKIAATFKSYKNVQLGSESALQSAVASQPGVSVAIDASSQAFQLYSSGVFNYPKCSSTQLDHGVLVVGYGVNNGTDYWLVKNSWGISWGLKGYIEMSRNKNNQCGIATDACFIQ